MRCCIVIPSSRRCRAPGSCIGSTRTRAACCSSRARSRARRRSRRRSSGARRQAHVSSDLPRRADAAAAASTRRSAAIRASARGWRSSTAAARRARAIACSSGFARTRCCEIELETGRTHQIRVHMAHIRAPLVGDPVYGGRPRLPPRPSDELRAALQALQASGAARGAPRARASGERRSAALSRARSRPTCARCSTCCARTPRPRDERAARLRARLACAGARAGVGHASAPAARARASYAALNLATHVGDSPERVAENRARCAPAPTCHPSPSGSSRCTARPCSTSTAMRVIPADGAVTSRAGVVCAVLTADCLPVIFASRDGRRVGVAHAGWRGLLERRPAGRGPGAARAAGRDHRVARARDRRRELRGRRGGARRVPRAHDAGADAAFAPNAPGRWHADLYALARRASRRRASAPSMAAGSAPTATRTVLLAPPRGAVRAFRDARLARADPRILPMAVEIEPG